MAQFLLAKYRFLKHKFGNIIIDDFSVKIKIEKYIESIKIQNPVPVLNNEELNNLNTHNQWNILEAKNYTKLHTVQYVPSNEKDTFKRELKGIYLVDKDPISDGKNNARSLFYDIVHTEFMFFIRAKHLESELSQTFTSLSFLNSMVDFVEEEWVKIRTLFSVIPRFSVSKKSVASKLFFYILEVNAQMYALLTNLKFNMEHKKNYYEEAFERLHFTVEKDGNDAEIQYFRDINTLVYKGYESYNNKIKMLDSSVTQLSDNIQQLRADFDSNTNIVLQWLMFLLSIVLVVWGGITFIYDKGVDTFSNAINNPMYLVVAAVIGTLLIMLVFYIYLAKIWINKSSELLDREIKYMIKNWLNDSEKDDEDHKKLLIHKYKKIMGRKLDYDKKITYSLEFCSLIIPGVALKKIDEKEAEEMLTLIRRNF